MRFQKIKNLVELVSTSDIEKLAISNWFSKIEIKKFPNRYEEGQEGYIGDYTGVSMVNELRNP